MQSQVLRVRGPGVPSATSPSAEFAAGRDVIGLAQTGSGKTGAFALPILQDLLKKQTKNFALVLSPTRELAIQVRHARQCCALPAACLV